MLKYMTDGMLLREFMTEPDLASYRYGMARTANIVKYGGRVAAILRCFGFLKRVFIFLYLPSTLSGSAMMIDED
jgi:hypothetical protein